MKEWSLPSWQENGQTVARFRRGINVQHGGRGAQNTFALLLMNFIQKHF